MELLTPLEVAHRLGMSQSGIYKWLRRGDLPGAVQTPRGWRIPAATVESIERLQAVQATIARKTPDELIHAWALDALTDFKRRSGLDRVPPAVLGRISEAIRTADLDDAA
jgi:excisionase family DNA binding protein